MQEAQEAMKLMAGKTPKQAQAALKAAGWLNIGSGSFKVGFLKGNVVVKVAQENNYFHRDGETAPEWVKAYNSLPAHLRHYLAKPLAMGQHYLIQEKAPNVQEHDWCYAHEAIKGSLAKAWRAAGLKWALTDGHHNHGHRQDGSPVWFDGL